MKQGCLNSEKTMSQSNNPRFWASQWYTTKFATEPWPGGWYWHDEHYNWFGPYESEHAAGDALTEHETSERDALDASDHIPSQFELYYHPLSPYSQKVLIAAYEKGAHFTPKIVNLMSTDEREKYRKLYPMGKLPLIVLNHGPLIPESSTIIEYLDSLDGKRLISKDPDVARKTRFKDRFFDFYLTDSANVLFAEGAKPPSQQDTVKIEAAQYRIRAVYDFIEYELREQTWANGEEFSMADCAAAAGFFYAARIMPYDDHPNVAAYAQKLSDRPSVKRVREEAAPYMQAYLDRIKKSRETA
jgi:glutathione S-transferase